MWQVLRECGFLPPLWVPRPPCVSLSSPWWGRLAECHPGAGAETGVELGTQEAHLVWVLTEAQLLTLV